MRSCLIFNPAARGDKARHFREHLAGLSAQCVLRPTTKAGEARPLAAQAVREGFDTIIAGGGDGTVNEVLNGIADAPNGLDRARLGVLPLGTVNVLARELGIPLDWRGAWKVLESGKEKAIDLPVAEFGPPEKPERRCFIQLGGAGLDSRAIELVNWEWKKKIGPLAYVCAGLKALLEKHPLVTAQTASGKEEGELVLLGNGRFYGGNFVFFPQANLEDGFLEVSIFPKVGWLQLPGAGIGLLTGQIHRFCKTRRLQAARITLRCPQRVVLELDGENVGDLPATISVLPRALRVIVPVS